jgi:uncharacterized membrane protein YobD (UPF0266 family)
MSPGCWFFNTFIHYKQIYHINLSSFVVEKSLKVVVENAAQRVHHKYP